MTLMTFLTSGQIRTNMDLIFHLAIKVKGNIWAIEV